MKYSERKEGRAKTSISFFFIPSKTKRSPILVIHIGCDVLDSLGLDINNRVFVSACDETLSIVVEKCDDESGYILSRKASDTVCSIQVSWREDAQSFFNPGEGDRKTFYPKFMVDKENQLLAFNLHRDLTGEQTEKLLTQALSNGH